MPALIQELRQPKQASDFTYPSDHVEYIDELRLRAAGALVEVAAAASLILKMIEQGKSPSDPLIDDLFASAQESVLKGGCPTKVLDLSEDDLRPGSLAARLASLYGPQAAYTPQMASAQTSERLAAASKLAEIDKVLYAFRRTIDTMSSRTLCQCLITLQARCWSLPDRLAPVPDLTAA